MPLFNQGIVQTVMLVHPKEREAQGALQKSNVVTGLAKDIAALKLKIDSHAEMRMRNFLATEKTAPRLFRQYRMALQSVGNLYSTDVSDNQVYPIFITREYDIRADVFGSEKNGYMIRLTSGAIESLNDAELRALLGQAIGHIRMGHVQFIEMLRVLRGGLNRIPVLGQLVGNQMWVNFCHWQFYSDYTADRIGAVCAGSIEAVLSLLCKQIGALLPGRTPYMVMEQRPAGMPDANLYLVWIAQSMPVFNAIGRMHELTAWSREESFKKQLPYMYYSARAARNEPPVDAQDDRLLKLHASAERGNLQAIAQLGECYLRGFEGLPGKAQLGLSMTRYAALRGVGGSMYLLHLCAESGMDGAKYPPELSRQLLRAAASRMDVGEAGDALDKRPVLFGLENIVRSLSDGDIRFTVREDAPGQPIETDSARQIRDIFLLEAGEPVIAYEVYRYGDLYCGTVITPYGIYGRMQDREMPFFVSWRTLSDREFCMMNHDHRQYLYCGKRRLYRVGHELEHSLGEVLVAIKSALSPQ